MVRRLIFLALAGALFASSIPAEPAYAVSTGEEIRFGKQVDEDIVAGSVVEMDPLLNRWVHGIAERLWAQTVRKDVPYNLKILSSSEVNAFSTLGGYVYIEEGALDFVQSDDELAALLGHETGHIERRHAVTLQSKAQAANLLLAVASLFSPLIYHLGGLAQAGLMAKFSRVDELQADQYGLLLMSRAGYDPDAMVTLMQHLGTLDKNHPDTLERYLQDHPEPDKRVSHLLGYEQLDPKRVTLQEILVQALHDYDSGRYSIAALKFQRALKSDPKNSQALLGLAGAELAIGQISKSEQRFSEAAQSTDPRTREVAMARIADLREMERLRVRLTPPSLAPFAAQMQAAQADLQRTGTTIESRRDSARDQLKSFTERMTSIAYEVPNFSRIEMRPGSRIQSIYRNIEGMARSIDSALDHNKTVIKEIGSLERNKEGGILKESSDILHELQAALDQRPMTAGSIAELPSYPRMLSDISAGDGDLIRSIDASRASLAMLDVAMEELDTFLKMLDRKELDYFGEINQIDYNGLLPLMKKATDSLNKSAIAASQAAQLFNMARARQLQTRITMLGLGNSPQRYATLQRVLERHVSNGGVDYSTMLHRELTPGEIATASILAADTNTTPAAIVQEATQTHRSLIDLANSRGMHAQALEIFLGLVYLDYTDDPQKEQTG